MHGSLDLFGYCGCYGYYGYDSYYGCLAYYACLCHKATMDIYIIIEYHVPYIAVITYRYHFCMVTMICMTRYRCHRNG